MRGHPNVMVIVVEARQVISPRSSCSLSICYGIIPYSIHSCG